MNITVRAHTVVHCNMSGAGGWFPWRLVAVAEFQIAGH